jgi:hypothetical protein
VIADGSIGTASSIPSRLRHEDLRMPAEAERGPRLQTGHLLLWVVGCAVGFAVLRAIVPADLATGRQRLMLLSSNVVWGTAFGTVLTGCGLMAYRRWRGGARYPSRAGHWLLLRDLAVDVSWMIRPPLLTAIGAIVLIINLAFLWAVRRRLTPRWIAVFVVSALFSAVRMIAFVAFDFYQMVWLLASMRLIGIGFSLADAVVILRAIGRDRRSGVPTDGMHRLGAVTMLAIDAMNVIFDLAFAVW